MHLCISTYATLNRSLNILWKFAWNFECCYAQWEHLASVRILCARTRVCDRVCVWVSFIVNGLKCLSWTRSGSARVCILDRSSTAHGALSIIKFFIFVCLPGMLRPTAVQLCVCSVHRICKVQLILHLSLSRSLSPALSLDLHSSLSISLLPAFLPLPASLFSPSPSRSLFFSSPRLISFTFCSNNENECIGVGINSHNNNNKNIANLFFSMSAEFFAQRKPHSRSSHRVFAMHVQCDAYNNACHKCWYYYSVSCV